MQNPKVNNFDQTEKRCTKKESDNAADGDDQVKVCEAS